MRFPYTALRWLGAWSTQAKRRGWQWGDWACSDRQRGGWGATLYQPTTTWKRTDKDGGARLSVVGPDNITGNNSKKNITWDCLDWTLEKMRREQCSTGTGFPGTYWVTILESFEDSGKTTASLWCLLSTCFESKAGLHNLFQSMLFWSCGSIQIWFT